MTTNSWNWKAKDGSRNGLLYESGNWGDLLKLCWLNTIFEWKAQSGPIHYFDPFAGDVHYPLSAKTRYRIEMLGLRGLDCIRRPFIEAGLWPSSAAAVMSRAARTEVFDIDADRRERWRTQAGASVLPGESGWDLLRDKEGDPNGLWLLDPYDFLAEWRQILPLVLEKATNTTIVVYIYNRAARNAEMFADYRAFRNALDDARAPLPKRLGRVPADAFLPRAHHEILFLPGRGDRERPSLEMLMNSLYEPTYAIHEAMRRSVIVDG